MTLEVEEDEEPERYSGGYGGLGGNEDDAGDLFTSCLNRALRDQSGSTPYRPVTVDADTLLSLKRSEVFVCRPPQSKTSRPPRPPQRVLFYRNMLSEISIAVSQPCQRFFHLEDFEFAYLSNGSCPFSRVKDVGEYGSL